MTTVEWKSNKGSKIHPVWNILESIANYGLELWNICKRNISKEKRIRCCRKIKQCIAQSDDITDEMGIHLGVTEAKRFRWCGHWRHLVEDRSPIRVWNGTSEQRRKERGQNELWKEESNAAITNKGLTSEDWKDKIKMETMMWESATAVCVCEREIESVTSCLLYTSRCV